MKASSVSVSVSVISPFSLMALILPSIGALSSASALASASALPSAVGNKVRRGNVVIGGVLFKGKSCLGVKVLNLALGEEDGDKGLDDPFGGCCGASCPTVLPPLLVVVGNTVRDVVDVILGENDIVGIVFNASSVLLLDGDVTIPLGDDVGVAVLLRHSVGVAVGVTKTADVVGGGDTGMLISLLLL